MSERTVIAAEAPLDKALRLGLGPLAVRIRAEDNATYVQDYQRSTVPGVLTTEAFREAHFAQRGYPAERAETADLLDIRAGRRRALLESGSVFHLFLHEVVLDDIQRNFPPDVVQAQARSLQTDIENRHATVRLLDRSHPGISRDMLSVNLSSNPNASLKTYHDDKGRAFAAATEAAGEPGNFFSADYNPDSAAAVERAAEIFDGLRAGPGLLTEEASLDVITAIAAGRSY